MPNRLPVLVAVFAAGLALAGLSSAASAQSYPRDDAYRPPQDDTYRRPLDNTIRPLPRDDAYRPPASSGPGPYPPPTRYGDAYPPSQPPPPPTRYGEPYTPPPAYEEPPPPPRDREDYADEKSFSSREILDAGHNFFGSISKGLANVIEYAFKNKGRPNGYILGQDAGGALVAGLRYGEGMLYTKDAGQHRVYWQGPSIGWDAGAEGSKVMVLVYNLRSPDQIYQRFPGVAGLAYLVGGVGITFQESDDVVVAPIRAGIGLRIGANVGYLKYTRQPTWNPF
ncbi:MAG: DUF1134 domain-containing protein [Hyphomicrobiales bacterium]|nr:MAG: DUF1134 domain-containing protein [Hyphomicrobiales bacterium]